MNTKTYLPIYEGYYNTIFDIDTEQEVDYLKNEKEFSMYSKEEIENALFDTIDFKKEFERKAKIIFEAFKETFSSEIDELDISLEFDGLFSPAYYNYMNDEIQIVVTSKKEFDIKDLVKKIEKNHDEPVITLYHATEYYLEYDRDLLLKELKKQAR